VSIVKKVIGIAEKFTEIHEVYRFKKSELQDKDNRERQNENWAVFEEEQGVYIFSNKDEVIYIGESGGAVTSKGNVGGRLDDHSIKKQHYWSESTKITILIPDKDRIFDLETHLRKKCKPKYDHKYGYG